MAPDDRRIFARIKLKVPLRFLDLHNNVYGKGETVDVSANGLGFVTQKQLPTNTPLEIWLDIPNCYEVFYTRGESVWTQLNEDDASQRVGVRLDKEEFMGLAQFLRLKNDN